MTLLFASLAPALAIALFIYWRDEHEKEPIRLLWRAYLFGALGVIPTLIVSILMSPLGLDEGSDSLAMSFVSVGLGIAVVEELSKFLGVRWFIYRKHEFNEPYDGIAYCSMAALGFASVENVMYVFDGGMEVAVTRALTAVPGHAIDGVFIGYFLGLQKFSKRKGLEYVGLAAAVLFHTLYDFWLFQAENYPVFILFFLITFIVALRLGLKAMKHHRLNSPFRKSSDRP